MKERLKQRPYIIPVLGLFLGVGIVATIWATRSSGETFRPSDAHVVYLFDSGDRHVLDTRAQTVGELIGRLSLNLIAEDVVEPTLDTPIVEDNFRVNIYRARPVTVVDGQNRIVTLTAQRSPRTVAKNAGLEVHAEDIATFQQGDLGENILGEQVVVTRATPITLNLYGTQVSTYTLAKTVEDMLIEKRIALDNGENVVPELATKITPNMQVFVLARGATVETEEQVIAAPTETVNDPRLSFGTTATRQEGSPGKKFVTYLITKKDNETIRRLIQEAIIDPAVPKIVARGTAINVDKDKQALMAKAGIRSSDFAYVNYIVSHESNWNPYASGFPRGTPYTGAYGLCQAYPGSKMATAGSDWLDNPVTQLRWCNGYAVSRYGGWAAAYNYWSSHGNW
ncbi:MAG TPA: G5 domain-containing protein [Candidatus Saccharimonadales bacterium]